VSTLFSASGGQPYQVHVSGVVARRIERVQRQASREGRGPEALSAFRQILDRLEQEPNVFGEGLYRLPALRMQIRHAAIRPLFVDFAVCEDYPIVFIKGVELLAL
jgi:hypothetical protein